MNGTARELVQVLVVTAAAMLAGIGVGANLPGMVLAGGVVVVVVVAVIASRGADGAKERRTMMEGRPLTEAPPPGPPGEEWVPFTTAARHSGLHVANQDCGAMGCLEVHAI